LERSKGRKALARFQKFSTATCQSTSFARARLFLRLSFCAHPHLNVKSLTRLLLGGSPACSSNFNGVPRPRPQNDSEGSVKLRIVQDRFWRTTSSINLCSSLSLSLCSLSSVRPSSIHHLSLSTFFYSLVPFCHSYSARPLDITYTAELSLCSKIELNGLVVHETYRYRCAIQQPTFTTKKYYIHDMYSSLNRSAPGRSPEKLGFIIFANFNGHL